MFRIVPYEVEHQGQYVALYIATWADDPYRERFDAEGVMKNLRLNEEFLYLLIEDPDKVVGFVGGRPLSRDCDFFDGLCLPPVDREVAFYIDELGVAKTWRQFGFGQALTNFLISVARERHFTQFVLRTHASKTNPAIRLYERLGFRRRQTADGSDHGVGTTQARIDSETPESDFRIYYYKTFQPENKSVDQRETAMEIIDLHRGADDFAAAVRIGLSSSAKVLSPRFFYDELGSILFEAICALDEYYVMRAEDEILRRRSDEIVAAMPGPFRLVELGCGTATKTRHLIEAALLRQPDLQYVAIDIDRVTLRATAEALVAQYNALRVVGISASFEDASRELPSLLSTQQPTLVLFLGSTIGNLEPEGQREILRSIRRSLHPGDALLLGADVVKSDEILIPAYDDPLGVTAAFNRNLLARINRELGGTFDIGAFRHEARYDRQKQRIEMHLVSTKRQRVTVRAAEIEIDFVAGESIHTENSYKFTPDAIELLAYDTHFRVARQWTDDRGLFGDNLLIAV